MKKITLVLVLLFITFCGYSQTPLTAGDIAFMGSNSDGATNMEDTVAFVLLKDIDAATTITFTDYGWNDAGGFFITAGDSEFTWSSGAAMTAGTIVTIDMNPLLPGAYSSIGDQLFAIQGTTAAPIFIAGLQFNDTAGDDANWDGAATSNSTSALPNALITGDTAVRLVPEDDNWQFNCALAGGSPITGTPAAIRATLHNRANWTSNASAAYIPAAQAGCTISIMLAADTTPPVISCASTPGPITAGINGMAAIPDLVMGTTATDDISIPANITITQSPTAGTMVSVGVHMVTVTATDEAGNTDSCVINVTVNEPASTTLAAGDIAFVGFNLDGTDSFAFILLKDIIAGTNIKFTDCGVNNPNTIICVGGDGTNTWYASAAMTAGTIVTVPGSFFTTAILASIGDQILAFQGTIASPVFIAGIHSNVEAGITNDTDWDGAIVNNDESALPNQLINGVNAIRVHLTETEIDNWQFDCSLVPGGSPISGTPAQIAAIINDLQYWINSDTIEFVPAASSGCTYNVNASGDTTPPTAVCMNITVDLDSMGSFMITATDVDGGSTDDVGIVSYSVNIDTFTCADIGTPVTVTLTVADAAGNTDSCMAVVTVEDNIAPTITCPGNQIENVVANCMFTLPDYSSLALVTENCSYTLTQSPVPGTMVGVGTITLTITVDDGTNTASCMFDVIVEDNEAPVITCAPDGTRDTDPGVCQYTVIGTEFDATFTDNCTSGSITNDLNGTATIAGEILPKGVTTVIWTVDDGNGQTATCTTVIM